MIRSFLQRAGLAATLVTVAAIKPRIDAWAAAATIVDERIGRKAH